MGHVKRKKLNKNPSLLTNSTKNPVVLATTMSTGKKKDRG